MKTSQMIDTLQETIDYLKQCRETNTKATKTYEKLKSVIIFLLNIRKKDDDKTIDDLKSSFPPWREEMLFGKK